MWFTLTEIVRLANGYPITTLELTTLSFSCMMVLVSIYWYFKPSISRSTIIPTKEDRTVAEIRRLAKDTVSIPVSTGFPELTLVLKTHPGLPDTWYRTPLYFISQRRFHPEATWAHASELTYLVHLPLFNRKMNVKPGEPWDRFPSDIFQPADGSYLLLVPLVMSIQIPYALSFLAAWTFHFPTAAEMWLWRACAIYHGAFTLFVTPYMAFQYHQGFADEMIQKLRRSQARPHFTRLKRLRIVSALQAWLEKWRNLSPDRDPDMRIQIRWMLPMVLINFIYIFCRGLLFALDFAGLRQQPVDVYKTVNRFVPFL